MYEISMPTKSRTMTLLLSAIYLCLRFPPTEKPLSSLLMSECFLLRETKSLLKNVTGPTNPVKLYLSVRQLNNFYSRKFQTETWML